MKRLQFLAVIVLAVAGFAPFAFGLIRNPSSLSAITGTVAVANGGTNATSQTTNGVNFFDGTSITSGSVFTFSNTNVGVSTSTPSARWSVAGTPGGTSPLVQISTSTASFASSTVFNMDSGGNISLGGIVAASTTQLSIGSGPLPYATAPLQNPSMLYMTDNAPYGGIEVRGNNGNATALHVHSGNNVFGGQLAEFQMINTSDTGVALYILHKGTGALLNMGNNSIATLHTFLNNGNVGFGTSTPRAVFQATASSSNATTSLQFGKPAQNKGTCITYYDTAGTPVYGFIATGATSFTYTTSQPSGCVN